jgi:phosphoribosylaminoimidazole carboxylase PurE protein
MAANPKVGILMGSDSDWPSLEATSTTLKEFGVEHEVHVMSAHRTPHRAAEYAESAASRGLGVIIAAAGGAAHLAGVVAAHTILPVIGVPIQGGALNGMDSLLATVQMPAGIPVATVAVGGGGPVNAGILAVQILARGEPALVTKLLAYKTRIREKVEAADAKLQEKLK